jgi:hypothetical protein
MRFKMFLRIYYFMQVQESKLYPQTKKRTFFSTGVIFNDLMNAQQRLIHNYFSVHRKLVN